MPNVIISDTDGTQVSEITPLLSHDRPHGLGYDPEANREVEQSDDDSGYQVGTWNRLGHHYPSVRAARRRLSKVQFDPRSWDYWQLGKKIILEPVSMLPAVFLGLLLNLLDALSYGIILFPLGEEAFKDLGPDGVSMFYVSCIIAQLVYSSGSIFRGGVGSEMIEVVPFFHKMTYLIMGKMGTGNPDALRATVRFSLASIFSKWFRHRSK